MENTKTGLDKALSEEDYELIVSALEWYDTHLELRSEKILGNEGELMLNCKKRSNLGKLKILFMYAKEFNKE